eukprot:scaffold15231_cov66-Cyclotella_meneghiniana.AAC.22
MKKRNSASAATLASHAEFNFSVIGNQNFCWAFSLDVYQATSPLRCTTRVLRPSSAFDNAIPSWWDAAGRGAII